MRLVVRLLAVLAASLVVGTGMLVISTSSAYAQSGLPPFIPGPNVLEVEEGRGVNFVIAAYDPEGTTISYAHTGGVPGLVASPENDGIRFTGTAEGVAGDVHSLTLTATDEDGQSSSRNFDILIVTGEIAAVVFNPETLYFTPGERFSYRFRGLDGNGQGLQYFASNLPTGVRVSTTGFITERSFPSNEAGWPPSTVWAIDSNGESERIQINWLEFGGGVPTTTTTITPTTTTTAPPTTTTTTTTTTAPPTAPPTTTTTTTTTTAPPRATTTSTVRPTTTSPTTTRGESTSSSSSTTTTAPTTTTTIDTTTLEPAPSSTNPPGPDAPDQGRVDRPPPTTIPAPVGNVLTAADDAYVLPVGTHTLPVAQNDQRLDASDQLQISEVSQPLGGTIQIVGDQIEVSTGDLVGSVTFAYTITDGITSDQATVTITIVGGAVTSANDLNDIALGLDPASSQDSTGLLPSLNLPRLDLILMSLNLELLSFQWVLAALVIPVIWLHRLRSASGWAVVSGIGPNETAPVELKSGEYRLRHDAEDIWVTGRKRKGLVRVETFAGSGWMNPDHLRLQT